MRYVERVLFLVFGLVYGLIMGCFALVATACYFCRISWEAPIDDGTRGGIDPDPDFDLGDESSPSPDLAQAIQRAQTDLGSTGREPKEDRQCVYH